MIDLKKDDEIQEGEKVRDEKPKQDEEENQEDMVMRNPINTDEENSHLLYSNMRKIVNRMEDQNYKNVYGSDKPIKEEKEEEAEEGKEEVGGGDVNPPQIEETNIQKKFRNLFSKGSKKNNSIRRMILFLDLIIILVLLIIYEGFCLFENKCYGQSKEIINEVISHSIGPLLLVTILVNAVLFFYVDYLKKGEMKIVSLVILVISLVYIGFFIFGVFKSKKRWEVLVCYVVIAVLEIMLFLLTIGFFIKLRNTKYDWRPPLRSRLHDDRASRIIDIHEKFSEVFHKIYLAEHKKQKEKDNDENDKQNKLNDIPLNLINDQIRENEEQNFDRAPSEGQQMKEQPDYLRESQNQLAEQENNEQPQENENNQPPNEPPQQEEPQENEEAPKAFKRKKKH